MFKLLSYLSYNLVSTVKQSLPCYHTTLVCRDAADFIAGKDAFSSRRRKHISEKRRKVLRSIHSTWRSMGAFPEPDVSQVDKLKSLVSPEIQMIETAMSGWTNWTLNYNNKNNAVETLDWRFQFQFCFIFSEFRIHHSPDMLPFSSPLAFFSHLSLALRLVLHELFHAVVFRSWDEFYSSFHVQYEYTCEDHFHSYSETSRTTRPPLLSDHLIKFPIGSSAVCQIAINETSRKRTPSTSDHLSLIWRAIAYGRFHSILSPQCI